ncbi:MAG TPA: divergent polysaccharide deacetylase family protein [Alphaproteobacteria bacterium]|nr:divergent polysaccharide deacetylase family protein [Alphaproteobacteria bacterium]
MKKNGFFQRLIAWLGRNRLAVAALAMVCITTLAVWVAHERAKTIPPQTPPEVTILRPPVQPERPAAALPRIAIVIDDVGMDEKLVQEAIDLPPQITLSFFPYAPHVQRDVDAAKEAGHEVFMHVPMQAMGGEDPGPGALRVGMNDDELRAAIEKNLSSFSGYDGVNNHMGSRFTADEHAMRLFMEAVKKRGVMFLDSRTSVMTKGEMLAVELGVPAIRRHVFLDNEIDEEAITAQFHTMLKMADHQRVVVAIAHPHHISLATLARLLPYLKGKYELVPISTVIKAP